MKEKKEYKILKFDHYRWNKRQFWQIFVAALEDVPTYFIQSKPSARAREYTESNRLSKYVTLLSNFRVEHRGLSPILKAGFRHVKWHLFPRLSEDFLNIVLSVQTRKNVLRTPLVTYCGHSDKCQTLETPTFKFATAAS